MADISAVKEITDKLENGVKDLFESGKYAAYLQTMSRFHRYSTRNTLLIHLQKPNATRVAGKAAWKNKFKRQVKKGEHGIKIFAPMPYVVKEELEKLDPVTKQPIIGEDGQPVIEEYIKMQSARFKIVSVFDVLQTEGEPLPELAETLVGDVARYELFMDALRSVSPLPIHFEDLPKDTDGTCYFGDRIAIRNGMSEIQTVSAVIHEIAHAKLHDLQIVTDNGEKPKDRRTEELEAESISFVVNQFFGVETGANSFGYIAEWSHGRELKELNASLNTIRKAAAELIDSIDESYRALAKERNIDLKPAITADVPSLIADYARNIKVTNHIAGTNVLLPPVFEGGNFNREGKRIRVTVEEPAGKYELFSRDEFGSKALYFLTASGMIDRTNEYFRDVWNGETRKWENHRPTEAELDEIIPLVAERFEKDLADPSKWAKYQHAAVLNRIPECEAHNVPVRKLREEESKAREAEAARERKETERLQQEKYNARVDEIATAIGSGKTISVGYNENDFDGKNPVLDLFKLYDIDLPLRTQGWVNTGLAEITDGSYRYYKGKHKSDSTTFGGYLKKLREVIRLTPIEQKRQQGEPEQMGEQGAILPAKAAVNMESKNKKEHELYEKLCEMFPEFMSGKYSYLRLESTGFEPLSLEWVYNDRISVMHTYELNGDLCYDPMMEFIVNSPERTLSATVFQQSIPPLYQYHDDNGIGRSVDSNGNGRVIRSLRPQLHEFSTMWFQNISEQGYMPIKANLVIGEDDEIRVTFDKDGNMIEPEPEPDEPAHDEATWHNLADIEDDGLRAEKQAELHEKLSGGNINKEYNLGYGFLGNGIAVWNKAEQRDNDYVTVAHISSEREVAIYDKDMPDAVREKIEAVAQSPDTWVIGFKPLPEMPAPEGDKPKMVALDMSLPDPLTTVAGMNDYGYTHDGILPMSNLRAVELFDTGHPVFLLYPDNTEAMALDREEIRFHDGLCGIERGDWERSPVFSAQMAVATNSQGNREAGLLYGGENKFGIYQIPDGINEAHNFRFSPMRELEALGLSVDRANYELVYTGGLIIRDKLTNLHKIYADFQAENPYRPADFTGRSVSVSDVIVLNWRGNISSYFVDSVGFKELSGFLGNETAAVRLQNDHTVDVTTITPPAPTVTELEADVKAGKSISLMNLSKAANAERKPPASKGKPSLLARLDDAKKQVEQNRHSAAASNKKEMGYE